MYLSCTTKGGGGKKAKMYSVFGPEEANDHTYVPPPREIRFVMEWSDQDESSIELLYEYDEDENGKVTKPPKISLHLTDKDGVDVTPPGVDFDLGEFLWT